MPNLRKQTLRLGSLDRRLASKRRTQNPPEMCKLRACGGVGMITEADIKEVIEKSRKRNRHRHIKRTLINRTCMNPKCDEICKVDPLLREYWCSDECMEEWFQIERRKSLEGFKRED